MGIWKFFPLHIPPWTNPQTFSPGHHPQKICRTFLHCQLSPLAEPISCLLCDAMQRCWILTLAADVCYSVTYYSVPTHPWKYLNFCLLNSRPWKYLKTGQVLESPWISFHRSLKVLEFTKSNYAISAASLNNICIGLECICFTYLEICQLFCLTQDLLIIVMFCFCQLKLSRNHRNR